MLLFTQDFFYVRLFYPLIILPMEIVTLKKDDGTTLNVHCWTREEIEKIHALYLSKICTAARCRRRKRACIFFVSGVVLILSAIVLLFVLH